MFIEGIAARIEAKPVEAIKYPDNAIIAMRAVGLIVKDGTKPVKENPKYIDFGSIHGYYNVRVGKSSGGDPATVGYVQIVTESRFKLAGVRKLILIWGTAFLLVKGSTSRKR
ncbi:hypothetical protein ACFLFF_08170 [Brevibacillus reuszeri]|uniref:hypothetical protein n=1 Tax=Brevibacillus reuszeri TaxID=54915 RepID=UPI001BB3DA7B|nr:hypothetical protein [Brevibacillus reuszeri]